MPPGPPASGSSPLHRRCWFSSMAALLKRRPDAAFQYQLEPSGITLEELRQRPMVELCSETLLQHGYPPVAEFREPLVGPRRPRSQSYSGSPHQQLPDLCVRSPRLQPARLTSYFMRRGARRAWGRVMYGRLCLATGVVRHRTRVGRSLGPCRRGSTERRRAQYPGLVLARYLA